jgi:glycine/D-amino acid oxidase-like deaminating enzyme
VLHHRAERFRQVDTAALRALHVLDRVGLPDKANAYPAQLSAGQQQRVPIARALAMQPLVRTDSFTDLYSPDGTPLVGRTTAGGRLLVAAGFSGRGFKYAPALAAVVADALVAGTEMPLGFMSPGRLSRETRVAGPLPR